MKHKKALLLSVLLLIVCIGGITFAHSGRTDANGGHRDTNNKSGLGLYHYHCDGYPAHLHTNGVCPYKSTTSSSSTNQSSFPVEYSGGYSDEYGVEYDYGYEDGYDKGYDEGHDEGYNEGYNKGYDEGHDEGYETRYDYGYDEGKDVGYEEGYNDGVADGKEDSTKTLGGVISLGVLGMALVALFKTK